MGCLMFPLGGFSQNLMTLEDIFSRKFDAPSVFNVISSKNGQDFIYQDPESRDIFLYDYKKFQQKTKILSSSDLKGFEFYDFTFNIGQTKLLLKGRPTPIYRHSSRARYMVFDIFSKEMISVYDQEISEPLFSPDGKKVAFSFENNLYIKDLISGEISQITSDGKIGEIINGIADWSYEEEFSCVRYFDWNPESTHLAFVRFDETKVPEFSMDIYGQGLYPTQSVFKYPKAGEENVKTSVFLYDLQSKKLQNLESTAYYIPRLKWANKGLSFMEMNRHQNHLNLVYFDVKTQKKSVIYTEKNITYVEIPSVKFLENDDFFITSEKSGYNHIYRYSNSGKELKQITKGNWEVTDFYGFNPKTQTIYYQSTEQGSINRAVCSVSFQGDKKQILSEFVGGNSAKFSQDFSYFILNYESKDTPPNASIYQTKNKQKLHTIIDNTPTLNLLNSYSKVKKEFHEFKIGNTTLNAWILKPQDFNPSKKYPVLMYQYSGPGSQLVLNEWFNTNDLWYLYLTQKGYLVMCLDGRGTGGKGSDFKKQTQLNLGKYETLDQIKAAEFLSTYPFIDKDRMAIWGWSFGGFIASNAIFTEKSPFKVSIAVAPVGSWRYYDTIYTERYMKTPEENPKGYDENSPIGKAQGLKGKYLLIHGSADDNVHIQNAMKIAESLINHQKDFDFMVYPDKNHSINGRVTRIHLYQKMTNYLQDNL